MTEQRVEKVFTPYLVVRLIPGAYKREKLPEEIETEEAATKFAIERAKHWKRKVCLVWSEQVTVWIDDKNGDYVRKVAEPGEDDSPAMTVKGKRFLFTD